MVAVIKNVITEKINGMVENVVGQKIQRRTETAWTHYLPIGKRIFLTTIYLKDSKVEKNEKKGTIF